MHNVRLPHLLVSSLHLVQQKGTGGVASHPGPLLGSLTIVEDNVGLLDHLRQQF